MYQVTKRDGEITEFNLTKISEAIRKAFEAREKEYNQDIIDLLALKVTADFEPKIKEHKIAVEDIQDSVESVLIKAGYADVAKGYILYRKQREKIRNLNSTLLDYKEIVDSYVKATPVRSQPITGCQKFTMRRLEKHTRMRIFISTIFLC